ncbi:MAG: response regulator transcription factor [Actinomycetaceae bacterium]|nr:response regulator transcription factor [Actinomycetaceae bacterium]
MRKNVLIVDDEPNIRRILSQYLQAEGYKVVEAGSGSEALTALGLTGSAHSLLAATPPIDLVLLDIGLPDIDGIDVLSRIRRSSNIYVMLVTARAEETDKLIGLNVGADDYVTKPFSVREIAARVKAAFRRMDDDAASFLVEEEDVIHAGDLLIDRSAHEVTRDGEVIELSALDFDLLTVLAERPGRVWSRNQLLEKVWGYQGASCEIYGEDRVVDVHIRTIRKALGDDSTEPRYIATVRGVGYKFVDGRRG